MIDYDTIIDEIHLSPWMGVIAITGGGTGAIDRLLHRGGGSNTVLEVVVPYATESFKRFLGFRPDQFCSESAARQLAVAAYYRALALSPGMNRFGLGVTASLAKKYDPDSPEREGRRHHIHIAYHTDSKTSVKSIDLRQSVSVSDRRQIQEKVSSDTIIRVIGEIAGVISKNTKVIEPGIANIEEHDGEASEEISRLVTDTTKRVYNPFDISGYSLGSINCVFPGSFNPLHDGHLEIARVAQELTGCTPWFEITVTNADKPPIDYIDVERRVKQFGREQHLHRVVLTNATLFRDKIHLFRNSIFVVGVDTWERILNPKYYGGESGLRSMLDEFKNTNTKFLIFGRHNGTTWVDPSQVQLPYHEYFRNPDNLIFVPEEKFRRDVSSSTIRTSVT